jgi:hypothetical protein
MLVDTHVGQMVNSADHLEGFNDLLAAAGRVFLHGTVQFIALVRDSTPDNERYDLTPTDDDAVDVTALRSDFPDGLPRVGAFFTDAENIEYRVMAIRRPPNSITVRFTCQVTHP